MLGPAQAAVPDARRAAASSANDVHPAASLVRRSSRFALDTRYVSPLAIHEPRPIAKLPFYPNERLTAAEIAQVKATPWNREWVLEPFERIYASYPTLFYLSLFAIAQPITEWLDLTPYQSSVRLPVRDSGPGGAAVDRGVRCSGGRRRPDPSRGGSWR